MYNFYKNNFHYSNQLELNLFISQILSISEEYINYLCYIGKIYLPSNMDAYDAAIDVTAELFKTEDNTLIIFANYFIKPENLPDDKEHFHRILKGFLYMTIQNNLINIFRQNDPVTYKIMRTLKRTIESEGYQTTVLFTDKFIHKDNIDFSSSDCMQKDELMTILQTERSIAGCSIPELLKNIFSILENNKCLRAVNFNDVVYIYKSILISGFKSDMNDNGNEEKIYFKLFLDGIKNKFLKSSYNYFYKKKISEKEQECIYNIIDEVINSYLNGQKHDSIKNLVDRHFNGYDHKMYYNKIEYLLNLLNKEILLESGYLTKKQEIGK